MNIPVAIKAQALLTILLAVLLNYQFYIMHAAPSCAKRTNETKYDCNGASHYLQLVHDSRKALLTDACKF